MPCCAATFLYVFWPHASGRQAANKNVMNDEKQWLAGGDAGGSRVLGGTLTNKQCWGGGARKRTERHTLAQRAGPSVSNEQWGQRGVHARAHTTCWFAYSASCDMTK